MEEVAEIFFFYFWNTFQNLKSTLVYSESATWSSLELYCYRKKKMYFCFLSSIHNFINIYKLSYILHSVDVKF